MAYKKYTTEPTTIRNENQDEDIKKKQTKQIIPSEKCKQE